MSIKTILFPTDFSEASTSAFRSATEFARSSKARLLIVHVVVPVMPIIGGEVAYLPPIETDPSQLQALLERIVPEGPSLEYSHRLLEGDPASEIVKLAKSEQVDMIVMGTTGRTGISRLLLGSTAEQVLRHAPCPVLMVKQPVKEPAQA